jgi:hypothetical protein
MKGYCGFMKSWTGLKLAEKSLIEMGMLQRSQDSPLLLVALLIKDLRSFLVPLIQKTRHSEQKKLLVLINFQFFVVCKLIPVMGLPWNTPKNW